MQLEVAGNWERTSPRKVAPSAFAEGAREQLQPVLQLLRALRSRAWQQTALVRAFDTITIVAPVLAVAALTVRSAWLPEAVDPHVLAALGLAALSLMVWTVAHRIGWFDAARIADRCTEGKDRLATAFELAATGRTDPWVAVQAQDAVCWAQTVDVSAVLPWRVPKRWPVAVFGLLFLLLSVAAPLPWTAAPAEAQTVTHLNVGLPAALPHMSPVVDLLDENQVELLTADVHVLTEIEDQLEPGPTRVWIGKVRRKLEDVVSGKLDKRGALEAFAELEKNRPSPSPPSAAAASDSDNGNMPKTDDGSNKSRSDQPTTPRASSQAGTSREKRADANTSSRKEASRDKAVRSTIANALKESLKHAPKSPEQEKLKEAAEKKDLDAISKWVEKMAQKEWSDKQLEKWIKVAEKFADKLGDKKIASKFDKLRKQVNRLQRKRERQGGLNSADRRRLRSARRNLQSLDRKHGDVKAARHQLQRLQRNTKQAAQQMRRRQKSRLGRKGRTPRAKDEARRQRRKAFRRNMSRASEQMRRMSQQQKQRQARRIGESRVRQAREAVARAGRRSQSRKDFERRARQQPHGQKRPGQQGNKQGGKQGKRSESAQSRADRMKQAQGASRAKASQRAKQKRQAKAGGQGQGRRSRRSKFRLGGADMPDDPRMRMMRDDGSRPQLSQMKRGGGEAPGSAGGGDPLGPQSKRLGVGRTERLKGLQNDGPTVKQTFIEAAKKGFARASWGAVYKDYSEVAEAMVDRQGLPVGRKALVRRYFELIRPRKAEQK